MGREVKNAQNSQIIIFHPCNRKVTLQISQVKFQDIIVIEFNIHDFLELDVHNSDFL